MTNLTIKAEILELKHRVSTATSFREPWTYFHDLVAREPNFANLGQPGENPELIAALGQAAAQVDLRRSPAAKTQTQARDVMLILIPELQFWHGLAQFGQRTGVFCFFSDTGIGLLGLMKSLQESEVDLARISLLPLAAGVAAFASPRGRA